MKELHFPEDTIKLIEFIEKQGFETYLVGGTIRDALLGLNTKDYDFATAATPRDLEEIFSGFRVDTTGLKHGTIRVITTEENYEITTFRNDGDYLDHRRPEAVTFVSSLEEDIKRRDFTINALAYHPKKGVIDLVGGIEDIEKKSLRAVGEASLRFEEDALRILRGIRLASTLDLEVEEKTKKAMIGKRDLLFLISKERIYHELKGILSANHFGEQLETFRLVFQEILPELQDHPYFDEVIKASEFTPNDPSLRLALLFASFSNDLKYNDQRLRKSLSRLKADNKTTLEASRLIGYFHESLKPTKENVATHLHQMGKEMLLKLIDLRDAFNQGLALEEEHQELLDFYALLHASLDEGLIYETHRLAIGGNDLLALGFPQNASIKMCLDVLLEEVMHGSLKNQKEPLLARAKELL